MLSVDNMSDSQLLFYASMAIGVLNIDFVTGSDGAFDSINKSGQAMRVALLLGISIEFASQYRVIVFNKYKAEHTIGEKNRYENYSNFVNKAVTKAAAEIGMSHAKECGATASAIT